MWIILLLWVAVVSVGGVDSSMPFKGKSVGKSVSVGVRLVVGGVGNMLSLPTCEATDMGNGEAEGGSEAAVVSGADSSSEFEIDSLLIPFCGECPV